MPGIFDFMDGSADAAADKGQPKPGDSAGNTPPASSKPNETPAPAPEVQKVLERMKDQDEVIKQLKADNEKLKGSAAVTDKIRTALVGDDEEAESKRRNASEREAYLADPVAYLERERKKIREDAERIIGEAVIPIQISARMRDAQAEISKTYDLYIDGKRVPWTDPRVDKKIAGRLDNMTAKYKNASPTKALIEAAHLEGLLKKKAGGLPSLESGGGYNPSPEEREKADEAEKAAIRKAKTSRLLQV